MKKQTPESYKPGVERIESMNDAALIAWLEAELQEKTHILAGQAEDYPVQAIVNHHAYLSIPARNRLGIALDSLVLDWRDNPTNWPEDAARALLDLVTELGVEGAKRKLFTLALNQEAWEKITSLQLAVLRTLAALSLPDDRSFWNKLPKQHPEFAGMAFQVLTRIAAEDALKLLSHLPDNEMAVGSVARRLPDFLSQFQSDRKTQIIKHIASAISMLSDQSIATLRLAFQNAGIPFCLPSSPQREKKVFYEHVASFAKLIRHESRLPLEKEYA